MSKQLCSVCGKKGDFFSCICEGCWRKYVSLEELEKEIGDLERRQTKNTPHTDYAGAWDDGYCAAMRDIRIFLVAKKEAGK